MPFKWHISILSECEETATTDMPQSTWILHFNLFYLSRNIKMNILEGKTYMKYRLVVRQQWKPLCSSPQGNCNYEIWSSWSSDDVPEEGFMDTIKRPEVLFLHMRGLAAGFSILKPVLNIYRENLSYLHQYFSFTIMYSIN